MEIATSQLSGLLGGLAGQPLAHDDVVFRKVLDALPAAVYVTDADGNITYFNDAAADAVGSSARDRQRRLVRLVEALLAGRHAAAA